MIKKPNNTTNKLPYTTKLLFYAIILLIYTKGRDMYLITSELLERIKRVCEVSKNKKLLSELEALTPFENNAIEVNYLQLARDTKTDKIKNRIRAAINELQSDNRPLTKYQVHTKTKIAYVTIKKYFDDILKEAQK